MAVNTEAGVSCIQDNNGQQFSRAASPGAEPENIHRLKPSARLFISQLVIYLRPEMKPAWENEAKNS